MFSKIWTKKSTNDCSGPIDTLRQVLRHADAVVIGAGAGLSTSAGFAYDGERFREYFSDFAAKYGIRDMYSGGFYPYSSPEEHWAYWSRYIYINRYQDAPKPVYQDLFSLVKDKDYFVLTTNVDHCFQKAGFDKKRLFYTQGDYGLFAHVTGTGWGSVRGAARKEPKNLWKNSVEMLWGPSPIQALMPKMRQELIIDHASEVFTRQLHKEVEALWASMPRW